MTATTQPRPKMTLEQAQTFQTVSIASAMQVASAIAARTKAGQHPGCQCNAYDDVFTFNRWKAQGYTVKKGEKALRIASFTPVRAKDGKDADPDESPKLRPTTLCLFCRCQVAENMGRLLPLQPDNER